MTSLYTYFCCAVRFIKPYTVCLAPVVWMIAHAYAVASPELKNIQVEKIQGQTVLIFEFSQITDFRMITLDKKFDIHHNEQDATYRLVIDTPHFKTKIKPSLNVKGSDFVSLIRYGSFTPQISRIVIESTKPIVIDKLQRDVSDTSQKLSVYISPTKVFQNITKQTANWDAIAQQNAVAEQQRQQVRKKSFAQIKSKKTRTKPLIVLDAGHGGHDPGAIGLGGIYEKNITLDIAKNVKKALESTGKFTVLLTRGNDRYISLAERSEYADENDANLFISIHADKHSNSKVRGMSVYTLNHNRQQREIDKVLDQNNKTAKDRVRKTTNHVGNDDISGILGELGLKDSKDSADKFAKILVSSMKKNNIVTLGNPTREASLGVLVARHTPSVLLEAAYMSNKYDVINLQSNKWRQRFSKALSDAIIAYFNTYPVGQ